MTSLLAGRHPVQRSLVAVVVLLAVAAAYLAWRAWTIREALTSARGAISTLAQDVRSGTVTPRTGSELDAVQRSVATAHSSAHDPVWFLASHVPLLGAPLRTVAQLTDASYALTRQAMPDLLTASRQIADVRASSSGDLPLGALVAAVPAIVHARDVLSQQQSALTATSGSWLPPVRQARADLLGQVTSMSGQADSVAAVAQLAPAMLGNSGPRRYFVGFDNPAELRSGGGLLGAFALLEARDGHLRVLRIGANSDLPALADPPAGLGDEWLRNYEPYDAGRLWVNTDLSPHFPSTAAAYAAMYRATAHTTVDGVLTLDPVALAAVLKLTGPVSVGHGIAVSSANVVDFLERDEYALAIPNSQRKLLLPVLGAETFRRLGAGGVNLAKLAPGLASAAGEGHIRLWSSRPAEQKQLAAFPIAGVMPETSRPYAEALITNGGGNKLDYYLRTRLTYDVTKCSAGREVAVTTAVTNTAPTTALPAYVSGRLDKPRYKVQRNQNRVLLTVALTRGSRFISGRLDGQRVGLASDTEDFSPVSMDSAVERGHPMLSTFLEIPPGKTVTLTLTLGEPASTESPLLPLQPLPTRPTAHLTGCR